MPELGWHFTDGMELRDGTPLEVGRTYHVDGRIAMCERGLHFSRDPLDALVYAPGLTLSRVVVEGIVSEQSDKGVARRRTALATYDVRDIVLLWAADVAERAERTYYTGPDDAPRKAIEMVRAHTRGEATREDCLAAAYAANAACDAAHAAFAAAYAADAAFAAANAAANAAAAHAAYAAAARLLRIRLAKLDWADDKYTKGV